MTTPPLFDLAEPAVPGEVLALADLDELIAYVRDSTWYSHFAPSAWVTAELSRIIGRDLPTLQQRIAGVEVTVVRYSRDAYLLLLDEARTVLTKETFS